jgi:hypothetical protein
MAEKPEQLTDKEWSDIKKMSDKRIRAQLTKEGYERETVVGITLRAELLEMLVECVVERKEWEKAEHEKRERVELEKVRLEKEREEERMRKEKPDQEEKMEREEERRTA